MGMGKGTCRGNVVLMEFSVRRFWFEWAGLVQRALCDIKVSRILIPTSYHHVQLQNKTLTKAGDLICYEGECWARC